MPRLEEVKKSLENLAYRKRALFLLARVSDDVRCSKSTPTSSEVLALASKHTHYECAFCFQFDFLCSQIHWRISILLFPHYTGISLSSSNLNWAIGGLSNYIIHSIS